LEDRDGMPDLLWLPPELPANVRLIVSTLPSRSLDELTRRQWPTLAVQSLAAEERTRLIVECLRQASKALSEERVRRLASAEQTANPLFLRALLEELRVFGVHERLDERIAYYLGAPSLEALFDRILERYEADYERERPGLVREAMTLLWAARRGLAEEEFLQLLGDGRTGEPLPQAYWSPLYLAAEHALTNRGGLIGFFHDYIRRGVEQRYLPAAEQRRAAHRKLAAYFAGREGDLRKVDELPWQLARAEAWEEPVIPRIRGIASTCSGRRSGRLSPVSGHNAEATPRASFGGHGPRGGNAVPRSPPAARPRSRRSGTQPCRGTPRRSTKRPMHVGDPGRRVGQFRRGQEQGLRSRGIDGPGSPPGAGGRGEVEAELVLLDVVHEVPLVGEGPVGVPGELGQHQTAGFADAAGVLERNNHHLRRRLAGPARIHFWLGFAPGSAAASNWIMAFASL
jgi:hypothetical protein